MNVLKEKARLITIGGFGLGIVLSLILSLYNVGASAYGISTNVATLSGFTIMFDGTFFGGLLLILAPAVGLALQFVPALNEKAKATSAMALGILSVLMLFIAKGVIVNAAMGEIGRSLGSVLDIGIKLSLAFGGILALLCYLLVAVVNGMNLFGGNAPVAAKAASAAEKSTTVTYCPNCGKAVPAGKAFCSNCGQKLN